MYRNFHFSDGVLNPNGVRFGSAEIYNVGKNIMISFIFQLLLVIELWKIDILLKSYTENSTIFE